MTKAQMAVRIASLTKQVGDLELALKLAKQHQHISAVDYREAAIRAAAANPSKHSFTKAELAAYLH